MDFHILGRSRSRATAGRLRSGADASVRCSRCSCWSATRRSPASGSSRSCGTGARPDRAEGRPEPRLQLRRTLGPDDVLRTRGHAYELAVADEALDAARFERLVEDGREALAEDDAERAAALLRDALALWRGTGAGRARGAEPWARAEAGRLEERRARRVRAPDRRGPRARPPRRRGRRARGGDRPRAAPRGPAGAAHARAVPQRPAGRGAGGVPRRAPRAGRGARHRARSRADPAPRGDPAPGRRARPAGAGAPGAATAGRAPAARRRAAAWRAERRWSPRGPSPPCSSSAASRPPLRRRPAARSSRSTSRRAGSSSASLPAARRRWWPPATGSSGWSTSRRGR